MEESDRIPKASGTIGLHQTWLARANTGHLKYGRGDSIVAGQKIFCQLSTRRRGGRLSR